MGEPVIGEEISPLVGQASALRCEGPGFKCHLCHALPLWPWPVGAPRKMERRFPVLLAWCKVPALRVSNASLHTVSAPDSPPHPAQATRKQVALFAPGSSPERLERGVEWREWAGRKGGKEPPNPALSSRGTALTYPEDRASRLGATLASDSRALGTAKARPPTGADSPAEKACPSHEKGFVFFDPPLLCRPLPPPSPRRSVPQRAHKGGPAAGRPNLRVVYRSRTRRPGAAPRCRLAAGDGTAPRAGQPQRADDPMPQASEDNLSPFFPTPNKGAPASARRACGG